MGLGSFWERRVVWACNLLGQALAVSAQLTTSPPGTAPLHLAIVVMHGDMGMDAAVGFVEVAVVAGLVCTEMP